MGSKFTRLPSPSTWTWWLLAAVVFVLMVTLGVLGQEYVSVDAQDAPLMLERLTVQSTVASGSEPSSDGRPVANREPKSPEQKATSISLKWSGLTANSDPRDIVRLAEESSLAEDRLSVTRILGICGATSSRLDENISERVQSAYPSGSNGRLTNEMLVGAIANARDRLINFCKPIDSNEMQAALSRIGARVRKESSPSKTLVAMDTTLGQSAWGQEQVQAVTTILSQPDLYSRGVDVLMERLPALPKVNGWDTLSAAEIDVVKSLAYQEITGDRNPSSLRNLFACMNRMTCEVAGNEGMTGVENPRIATAAQALVDIIRTQRWSHLGM